MGDEAAATLGTLLKEWRSQRKLSQLDLALEAGVSARHLSFLESGRAAPGREVLLKLAGALALEASETNALLLSAGFAPARGGSLELHAPALAEVNGALLRVLEKQRPYPAFALDEQRNILLANPVAEKLLLSLPGLDRSRPLNLLELVFDPRGLRPLILNWEEVAGFLVHHVRREQLRRGQNGGGLLGRLLQYGPLPDLALGQPGAPLLESRLRINGQTLRLVSMITVFGSAMDLAVQELLIESFFPADEETETFLKAFDA